jgi:hypothetical protein
VHPRVCGLLAVTARHAQPCETGGLVAGRLLRDTEGPYTLVLEAVTAPREAGQPGRLTLSPELTARLRERAAGEFPSCDIVGWWHSHTVEGGYSEVDQANQRMWTDPGHVGLLVFARASSRRALAYLGPGSRLMRTLDDEPFVLGRQRSDARHGTSTPARRAAPLSADPDTLAIGTALRLRELDRGWRRTVVAAAVICGLALAGCLVSVTRLANTVQELAEPAAVSWSCLPQGSDRFMCRFSPPQEQLQWWRDGQPVEAATDHVVVTVPRGESTWIELRRGGDAEFQLLGGLTLTSTVAQVIRWPLPGRARLLT